MLAVCAALTVGALAVLAASCSTSGDDGSTAATVEKAPVRGSSAPDTTGPPITFARSVSADDLVGQLASYLPLADGERECVVARLNADDDLRGRLADGLAPGSPEYEALVQVAGTCRQSGSFGDQFAASVADGHPGTTAEQRGCLRDRFGSLAPEQLQNVVQAAVTPELDANGEAQRVVHQLLAECGVA